MTVPKMRSLARALAVAVLAGGPLVLAPASVTPVAGAATCTSAGGVSVVVDFRELGGSTITACAADGGGRSAAEVFASVGVNISYATRQPGFVCRVQGAPAGDPCVNASPASAYWGLWWADGSKASWTYSSSGVGGLTVPAGGSVGWSWQQDRENSGAVPPDVVPPVAATPTSSPTASPTASATTSATATPSGGGGSSGGAGGGSQPTSPSPTSGSTGSSTSPQATPSGSPTDPSESPLASESPGDSRASGASGDPSDEPSLDDESPGDSTSTEGSNPSASASESPGDSSASSASEAGSPTAEEPARVPAAVTWGIVGLLAIAIAVSAVVARRRRGV